MAGRKQSFQQTPMSNPALTRKLVVDNLAETGRLAVDLASRLRGGEVVILDGDLGAGKTAFVKALVDSLGGPVATSPSFTIENIYPTPSWSVHHYDFYRLSELGVDGLSLTEVIRDGEAVVLIEWAALVRHLLGPDHLELEFQFDPRPTARRLIYRAPESLAYLLPSSNLLTKPS